MKGFCFSTLSAELFSHKIDRYDTLYLSLFKDYFHIHRLFILCNLYKHMLYENYKHWIQLQLFVFQYYVIYKL